MLLTFRVEEAVTKHEWVRVLRIVFWRACKIWNMKEMGQSILAVDKRTNPRLRLPLAPERDFC